MSRPFRWILVALVAIAAAALVVLMSGKGVELARIADPNTYTVDVTDYTPRASLLDALLTDDDLETKVPKFDPGLVHPVAIDGWNINLSAAVIRLDVPMIEPDHEADLVVLHPSYAAAIQAAAQHKRGTVLPSVNMIDGLAKQFDDGLYAAIDLAYYQGLNQTLASHVSLVKRIFEKTGPQSPAAPFLAAGLEVAGEHVSAADAAAQRRYGAAFAADEVSSKPIGFYTWTRPLEACFRFLRFFQRPTQNTRVATAIADALRADPGLRADYQKAIQFYSKLTNPPKHGSLWDLVEDRTRSTENLALFPSSRSRETELFERLFPSGLPPSANLMKEFVQRIRSGEVKLAPSADSGWYDYQVFALEALVLPEKMRENTKLLLTKSYKQRMIDAFQALVTKRRETHSRLLEAAPTSAVPVPLEQLQIEPPLRLEPALTYYLRTAGGYEFLLKFLTETVGEKDLKSLHALRQAGPRAKDLLTELRDMRDLFVGFYLAGCQDIGLAPEAFESDGIDRERCLSLATEWLAGGWKSDSDLAADTRVGIPISTDPGRGVTRLWVTLGVRLARLDTRFERAPKVRPASGGEWVDATAAKLGSKEFTITVDEFAEVELKGLRVLNRVELRAICDRHKTKEAIVNALSQ
jgi:hypothetical protein